MSPNDFADAILNLQFADIVQVIAIIFTLLYLVFAFIILRQVQLMIRTLPSPISPLVIFLAWLHIGITLVVLIALVGII